MRGTFIRWSISRCKSLRIKHQTEMNQTISLWVEPNFPYLAGATLSKSLSLSSSQPGHTNIVENGPPHHWIKNGLGLSKRMTTRPCCTVLHSTGLFPKYTWGLLSCGVLTNLPHPTVPVHPAPQNKPLSIWVCSGTISLKLSKILLHFQAKCSSSHVRLEPQHEKYLTCHYEKNSG